MKERYLKLLGSKKFLEILEKSSVEHTVFNKLLIAHLTTIGSQSNGIKEGTCYIEYVTSSEDRFTPNVIGPKLNFSFFTNSYALIEHTNRGTRANIPIKNTNDFNHCDFHNTYTFKNFLLNYESKMKHLPGHTFDSIKNEKIKIQYQKPSKEKRIDYFYKVIISNNKDVENFITHYFLTLDLKTNNATSRKNKL